MADIVRSFVDTERQFVSALHGALGFPEDQLKTVLCMLAAYPLAFILKVCGLQGPTIAYILKKERETWGEEGDGSHIGDVKLVHNVNINIIISLIIFTRCFPTRLH